ncbi:MAG: hypothetical protein ACXWYS_03270 [Gaiellaceae bacterium]
MWLVRALIQLLLRVASGIVLALALAVLLALVRGGGFRHAFDIACWSVGVLAILMGAVGQSTASRTLATAGRMPGLPATFRSQPGDTTVSTAAVFFFTGAVLIVLGVVLA